MKERDILLAGAMLLLFILFSCQSIDRSQNKESDMIKSSSKDPHSYALPEEAIVTHLDLSLIVNYNTKNIEGEVVVFFQHQASSKKLILDTKGLNIRSAVYADGKKADFKIHEENKILGSALEIPVRINDEKIIINYYTAPGAEALQWLTPEQTADKKEPFLFTQSQAILARSWIPLQDSPGIRFTYTAKVTVPKGYMVLMSAENPQKSNDTGVYHFKMDQPIPSYLMSLVTGKFEFIPIGKRTGVYAESSMIEKSKFEFQEMEDMLEIAEGIYGKYQWDRYDLIVLPPSFPFGGMENPRITFATPSIITGDRSLTSLVAHELAHSWSGNLVTNATWNDFWLNEGFTVYFEHRIMEALKGSDYAEMLSSLSLEGLKEEVGFFMKEGKAEDTKLKLNLAGRNPDDGVTTIAYDKGYFFLKYLEQSVGKKIFDAFINQYFKEYAFKSNNTEAFLIYLDENLFKKNGLKPMPDINEWIYETGLPKSLPNVNSSRFENVEKALNSRREDKGLDAFRTEQWSTHEWIYFIKNLPEDLSEESIKRLDELYDFTDSGNAEILGVWFVHCARHLYQPSFRAMTNFLTETGRRKFLMPIYTELIKSEEGKSLALSIYKHAKPNYHFVASNSLDKILF